MTTIFQALSAVMADVQGVKKADKNTSPSGGFMFRGIDAVTNAVGPALRKHGVIVVPEVLEKVYGTVVVGKNRTEMGHSQLTIAFTWYGPEGDSIRSVVAAEAMDSGDKATAKAHSVAFRTSMIQTLALPTDEPDPDVESHVRSEPAADVVLTIKKELADYAASKDQDIEWLKNEFYIWSPGGHLSEADLPTLTKFKASLIPEPTTRVRRSA